MAQFAPLGSNRSTEKGYRVELPRECDAIGAVLRTSYTQVAELPGDMAMLLNKIDTRL